MVRDVAVSAEGAVDVTIALTTAGCPLRGQIQRDIRHRVGSMPGRHRRGIEWGEMTGDEKRAAMERARFNMSQREEQTSLSPNTQVVLIASGKGGVGKSSVTVNLAVGAGAARA